MATIVTIQDNASGKRLSLAKEQWDDLSLIAGRTVKKLCDGEHGPVSLLVFPDSLNVYGDSIGDSTIIDIRDEEVSTGNLMGFVGCRQTMLRIHSRFDREENDYFMHYMLERVFSVNLFDLQYSTDPESVFDFVLFLFPFFLNKALTHGLYKEYVTHQQNDSRIRGAIDVSRHIRQNIPFSGKVAYRMREHTADNDLMELVRHTIEYIRTKEFGAGILHRNEETKSNVGLVIEATGSYEKRERNRIINKNLRSKIHPYFSEYEPLRKLCIQILRQEEIKYGKDDDTVYGVLFDGAWLWEEYLDTILSGIGFKHPQNKIDHLPIYLFAPKRAPRYPDFHNERLVLDAKYKRYEGGALTDISREDLAQVISYMYVQKLNNGGFLVPGGLEIEIKQEKLLGHGGNMFLLNIPIPSGSSSYVEFCEQMVSYEKRLVQVIGGI
ncbi:MAG: hypothetical protein IJ161_09570 [Bacteroidales bacterium]|nr:hypothetical protein [Bacteroidales bacterium]